MTNHRITLLVAMTTILAAGACGPTVPGPTHEHDADAGAGAAGEAGQAGAPSSDGGEGGAAPRTGGWWEPCGQAVPEHEAGAAGMEVDVPAYDGCRHGLDCVSGTCTFACGDSYPGEIANAQKRCSAMGGTCEGFPDGPTVCAPLK